MSIEFTGERVIPGLVDDDLWNEHYARYAFAARFCADRRVLDAGCGTGYGANALSKHALQVTGVDLAYDAVQHARREYPQPGLIWTAGSCDRLPFVRSAFHVVVAFEVIEHLRDWPLLVSEAKRVLTGDGLFLVSTPNKSFYAEAREQSGPNPFHEHEFELDEFRQALQREFPYVKIAYENHAACVLFESEDTSGAEAQMEGASQGSDANFYIAICSSQPIEVASFVYVPKAANLLKERAKHILWLQSEVTQCQGERAELVALHAAQKTELEANNAWAKDLDAKYKSAGERIIQLQNAAIQTATEFQGQLTSVEQELEKRTEWARGLEAELRDRSEELARCVTLLDRAEATVVERTNTAIHLQSELDQAQARLAQARSSRWVKLGRRLNLGPELG